MPDSNIASESSFIIGESDTDRYGFTIARRETGTEKLERHQQWADDASNFVNDWLSAKSNTNLND